MKGIAYLLVFDGLADWETGLAASEIHTKPNFQISTVGFTNAPITTRGGMRVLPDLSLAEIGYQDAKIFIMPGGDRWLTTVEAELIEILNRFIDKNIPVAGICGATVALAKAGLFKNRYHTSNSLKFLREAVPDYQEAEFYQDRLAARDKNVISASGAGNVEFALEIIKQLDLYNDQDCELWFNIFKHGIMP